MVQEWEKKTNVKFKFEHPTGTGADAQQQFGVMVASGDLPDLIVWNMTNFQGGPAKLYQDGTIIKLNELIDQYAPNLKKILDENPLVAKQIKADNGDLYVFPNLKFWSSIPKCFEEAEESLEYKLVLGSNQIIAYESVKRPKHELYYPLDKERQLINQMAAGDYEQAAEVLQRILMANFSDGTLSPQMGKLLMFELAGTMLKAVEQFQLGTTEIMVEKTDLIKQITQCETFAEMEVEILTFLKTVCDYLQQKKKSHNTDLKSQIVEHVLDNLSDMNLSLTSIALAFDINPTYLSRFFKEQTGENLIDFVNKRRIDKVKDQLTSTDDAIQNIAEQCGFASSQSLLRVFKKYEGITPGQYRQSRG